MWGTFISRCECGAATRKKLESLRDMWQHPTYSYCILLLLLSPDYNEKILVALKVFHMFNINF